MKHTLLYIVAFATLLICGGCQNDGNIGDLFGTWRVDSYERDGAQVEIRGGATFSFQNSVVNAVLTVDDYGTNWSRFGSWEQPDDKTMRLDFTHHDDNTAVGTGIYAAPEWLGMTSAEVMTMDCTLKGDDMTWTWTALDGARCVYKLHKTW